jgi:paired small multidrug resistance pump
MDLLFNLIGTAGVIFLLVGYFLVQRGTASGQGIVFPVLNFIGAGLIAISLINDWNFPAFLIEACWMVISLYGMWQYHAKKRHSK